MVREDVSIAERHNCMIELACRLLLSARSATRIPAALRFSEAFIIGNSDSWSDRCVTSKRQRIRISESGIVSGERTVRFGVVRMQNPLIQLSGALAPLIDSSPAPFRHDVD